ncbi:hypothetical protein QUC32_27050 (plasmid) [Novosphingobium resinovorum]|jgi:hypothetical protein|uniref:Uncharacterized protein n=1 Tax=Novosphingobium resinovorum TaxID=158500 RepID=A0A1D8AEM6_9SPHN|nr:MULTISPECIES: hypothetical protein [Novosphingobium]AOR80578.1 hypothetical protein BES08_27440 [Novosphingobium resinovorum]MBF7015361.1 hypothetical protein [Novosphingobium sp. HR1a]WJM30042.1 hypothetical protein QUC32_27050 [Novosphingobium resinovorum]
MKAALPLAILFTVVPMALAVATTRASGVFQLRPAGAPPLTRYERWRRFALLNWIWLPLAVAVPYVVYNYITGQNPWMLLMVLSISGLCLSMVGPARIAWLIGGLLAACLIYSSLMHI